MSVFRLDLTTPVFDLLRSFILFAVLAILIQAGVSEAANSAEVDGMEQGEPFSNQVKYLPAEFYGQDLFGQIFSNLNEQPISSLLQDQREDKIIRLLWIRMGRPNVCVRIMVQGDQAGTLTVKEFREFGFGAVKAAPREISLNHQIVLSSKELKRLSHELGTMKFFELPMNKTNACHDCALLVLEVNSGGRYHAVCRDQPNRRDIESLIVRMLKLAGVWPTRN